MPYAAGFVTRGQQATFLALALAALYPQADAAERRDYDAELARNRDLLRQWAEGCAANYGHLHLLVEAECARIAGQRIEAADFYDRAIALAREHGFVNIEALAAELAARFWFADGKPDFGGVYLEKALHALRHLGRCRQGGGLARASSASARRATRRSP